MRLTPRSRFLAVSLLAGLYLVAPASAQLADSDGFVTGEARQAYALWNQAMRALVDRNMDEAEARFGELLALEPSPFRVALLADRSVQRNENAGGVLFLEQDYEAGTLPENGRAVAELLEQGREHMNEADDGWYFASIGRFDISRANFLALLEADPDPVALLEFAERNKRRHEILLELAGHPLMAEAVKGVQQLLAEGERRIKADPTRIRQNIEALAGPPRAFENAVARLRTSGEYAIPLLIETLRDPEQQSLVPPILRTLPQIGRDALNPLVMALRMDDQSTLRYVIRALGQIGYWQAVPYLLRLRENPQTPPEIGGEVTAALSDLSRQGQPIASSLSAADAFFRLAEAYYDDQESLAADPRLETANVWYWRDGLLQNVEVPTQIFNEVMCMRSCEEALRLAPDMQPALGLWLAANFRRAAQLGPDEQDHTRPANYPEPIYFAQSAGPEYNLMALARAVDDGDASVALGAIEALRKTAGPASLTEDHEGRLPLAEALSFPNRLVRVRAALALGAATPQESFPGAQNLVPVLIEALNLFAGSMNALVVDPDSDSANDFAALLRDLGYNVATDAGLYGGLQKVRAELPGLDVVLIASDVAQPAVEAALADLRKEVQFTATPVLLIRKRPTDRERLETLARDDARVGVIPTAPDAPSLQTAIATVSRSAGAGVVTEQLGSDLALEAATVLRELADAASPVADISRAVDALVKALESGSPALRRTAAQVLGYVGSEQAQSAIAEVALNDGELTEMRVAMFGYLADAAKRHGNHLPGGMIERLIGVAESADMTIRTAASEALGALNLPGNPASEIIRSQYSG